MARPLADTYFISNSQMSAHKHFRSRRSSSFFSRDRRHWYIPLADMQANPQKFNIETNKAAATGAVFSLETGNTELFLESTAAIWTALVDKVGQNNHTHICLPLLDADSFRMKGERWWNPPQGLDNQDLGPLCIGILQSSPAPP